MHGFFNQQDKVGNPIYPYLPKGHIPEYVSASNPFMAIALKEVAKMEAESPEVNRATAAILVIKGRVVAKSRNGSIHSSYCPRIALGSLSGQDYNYCPDHCHGRNHAEVNTIKRAQETNQDIRGADLYLAGHWWACQSCWDSMLSAKINHFFLVEGAHHLYDEKIRRKRNQNAGILKNSIKVSIYGKEKERFSRWLTSVNFTISPDLKNSAVVVLLPGAKEPRVKNTQTIYDYRDCSDIKIALLKLSQNISVTT